MPRNNVQAFPSKDRKPVNQQERLEMSGWIVGFTDGEGCFSVSLIRNTTAKIGWQVFPEFVITQGAKSRVALEEIQIFFECGRIYENRRYDNHREHLLRYCVRSIQELRERIIPFFQQHELKTHKKNDFKKFCEIISLIEKRHHLTYEGVTKIAQHISEMNRKSKPKFLESSETTRRTLDTEMI